ncbi:MAG TPA: RHS repeat-associated core domain-containing protein [Solirubrobacterales bacterium]|nr:RHS repeat-associated core domain-containing protein [Solirubrobacterales bacterium]
MDGEAIHFVRRALGVLIVSAALLGALSSPASAAECTDTWTGPAEGGWQVAANWSAGHVPTEADVACIGAGKTVMVSSPQSVGVVQGAGGLYLINPLTLTRPPGEAVSTIAYLTLSGGSLTGAGTIEVSSAFVAAGGSMSGTGSTILASGAVSSIESLSIGQRTLVNDGSLLLGGSYLSMTNSAKVENLGTFTVNAEGREYGITHPWSDSTATMVNAGTLRKAAGTGQTEISVTLTNFGAIDAESGNLSLWGQTESLMAESTLGGPISLTGPTVNAQSFSASGTVTVGGSTSLNVEAGYTAATSGLTLEGTLKGPGTLQVSKMLSWARGTMCGTGSTVLLPGVTGTANEPRLYERTLVNEGSLSGGSSFFLVNTGAKLENRGMLTLNAEGKETGIFRPTYTTAAPLLVNSGTIQKTSGSGTSEVGINLENTGTITAGTGILAVNGEATALKNGSVLEGAVSFRGGPETVSAENVSAANAIVFSGSSTTFMVEGTSTVEVGEFTLSGGWLKGTGTLKVSKSLIFTNGRMEDAGKTLLLPSGTGTISGSTMRTGRVFVNEGTTTLPSSYLSMTSGAKLENRGTFDANTEGGENAILLTTSSGNEPAIVNRGVFQKTSGLGVTEIQPNFENGGLVRSLTTGSLKIVRPLSAAGSDHIGHECYVADPVNCATGDLAESQTDFQIGGRGIGLVLTRTYSAQAAAVATSAGAFGYGWASSFGEHLTSAEGGKKVTLTEARGGTVTFTQSGSSYVAPAWSQDLLSGNSTSGYTLTLPDQSAYRFSGAGRLEAITDRNGNETAFAYDEAGRLKSVTDPSGRQLTFAYNAGGQVESATDPMGHVVKYAYESGNLVSVTMPGEASPRWQFKYGTSHRITQVTDGRGGKTTDEYDGSNRVISQTDPAGRTTTFKYEPFHTTITNKATGAVTDEWFTSNHEPFSITRGFGTASATTRTFRYDEGGRLTSVTDGNGHTTTYGYDGEGNRTSAKDPLGHETKWAFDSTHDLISTTTPRGETTTIARDAHGNVESISRPAPGEATQTTSFEYGEHGLLESVTNPLGRTWSFGYDGYGDRDSETDPLGHTQTLAYDKDSRLVSSVSPRGNLEGAEPAEYETSVERDAQGRPLKVTDPLGHATEYAYDANGNLASLTDAKGHTTKYTYNADDEQTKVEKPDGAVLQTGYDGAGYVTSQTDANEHTTIYVRNVLGQPVEVVDPLGRKTLEAFDAAGNLTKVTDAAERTASYSYDAANRLTGVDYSEEATPDAGFEYDADGNLVAMTDGTGESSFAYDQLGHLTKSEDGHGDVVEYGYDLADEPTGIAYPNGKEVSRSYDKAGRLESVGDWLGGKTSFAYDADSNLTAITFPSESGNADEYSYDRASQISEAKFKKGTETLASLTYTRDPLGQVEAEARKGLPGPEELSYGYDEANRLVKAGAESFEYDPADNLTKGIGQANAYDAASQLETGTGLTYSYDKLGERTKVTPASGPATSYGYDQAGGLTSVARPEEGEVPAISETMAYDGAGLLASRTSGLTTHYLSWDLIGLPMLLNDGERSYVYGPGGLPIEQISSEEPTYLHHDQLGSTRLLTGATGTTTATFSYAPYGGLEGKTGTATTPLGFAGQYTDAETGLQYLRARFYDSGTGQFLSRDPIDGLTRQPYSYALDNPLNRIDPSGLFGELIEGGCIAGEVADPAGGCVPGAAVGAGGEVVRWGGAAAAGAASWVASEIFGGDESSSADEAKPQVCPEPWAHGTEIGDARQSLTFADQFADKLLSTAGGGGPGGSRGKALVTVILILIHAARHSG